MKVQTKQRIIGGIVLLAVAAIFLPLLFHNSHPSADFKLSAHIPPAPAKPDVQLQLPPVENSATPSSDSATGRTATMNMQTVTIPAATTAKTPTIELSTSQVTAHPSDHSMQKTTTPTTKIRQVPHHTVVRPLRQSTNPAGKSTGTMDQHAHLAWQPSLPSAWVIQLASFTRQDNANRLIQKLRQAGFTAYTRQDQAPNKKMTRVFIGPEINHAKMAQIQQRVQQQFQLHGIIKRYSPW